MRAMILDRYGDPDVIRFKDVPVPEPQEGEVLIRVGYAGVNPADSKLRAGHAARLGYRYVDFPFVIGMDAAGVVERTGANVTELRRGDRVITVRRSLSRSRRRAEEKSSHYLYGIV
jgi:NADPH2:quinone reductase